MSNEIQRKIQIIKDQREAEAKKKNLYEKLSAIAKGLGQPVLTSADTSNFLGYEDGDASFGMSFSNEPTQEYDPENMEILRLPGEDWKIRNDDPFGLAEVHGWHFEALREGCNFEVFCCESQERQELRASYEGYIVYLHRMGELEKYLPDKIWESKVDHWAAKAKPRFKKKVDLARQEQTEYNRSILQKFKDYIKTAWGLDT